MANSETKPDLGALSGLLADWADFGAKLEGFLSTPDGALHTHEAFHFGPAEKALGEHS